MLIASGGQLWYTWYKQNRPGVVSVMAPYLALVGVDKELSSCEDVLDQIRSSHDINRCAYHPPWGVYQINNLLSL